MGKFISQPMSDNACRHHVAKAEYLICFYTFRDMAPSDVAESEMIIWNYKLFRNIVSSYVAESWNVNEMIRLSATQWWRTSQIVQRINFVAWPSVTQCPLLSPKVKCN